MKLLRALAITSLLAAACVAAAPSVVERSPEAQNRPSRIQWRSEEDVEVNVNRREAFNARPISWKRDPQPEPEAEARRPPNWKRERQYGPIRMPAW